MPRIVNDPTQAICPEFEGPAWNFMRQSIINMHQGPQPLTAEEATQQLTDAWALDNATKLAAWNIQLDQDQVVQAEQEKVACEQEEAQRIQHEKDAEEQRKEAEKKKPKLNSFDVNRSVGDWIEPRPAPYALNKINSLEYVELDYFTIRGCRDATTNSSRSTDHNMFGFSQHEGAIAIRPLAAQRASRNIRNDEELSWEEMLDAKNTMLYFMAQSGMWPDKHAESLAAFFVGLELHPRRLQPNGKKALLMYQSHVRQEWFSALKRDQGFNIEIIGNEYLRSCYEIVSDRARDRDYEQV